MRILIVEDHSETARSMELMLQAEGHNVYTTDLGEEGVDLAKIYEYDLITLDLGLPDMSGLEALRQIRVAGVKTPILIVSGKNDLETKVKTFGLGADDYLTKPFAREEFVARVGAIIRRSKGHASHAIVVGPITVDLDAKSVSVNGATVHLTGKEYAMLELLAVRLGQTLTKDAFLTHLYGGMDEPEVKIVDVFICKLRKKLELAGAGGHIDTVWGRGYRLTAEPVSRVKGGEVAPAGKRDPLAGLRAKCLIILAEHGRDLRAATIALKLDIDAISSVYASLSLSKTSGHVETFGAPRNRTYRLTDAGLKWLESNGWTRQPEAVAA